MSAPAVADRLVPLGAMLGEGPIWIERDQALWFVDIKAPSVHRYAPDTQRLDTWRAPDQVGWILPSEDGGLIVGLAHAIARFDPSDGTFASIVAVEPDMPHNRLNDATLDHEGRLWFGSMDNREAAPTGRFYRYLDGAIADSGIAPVAITNGPTIAPNGRTLYTVDTLARTIDAHDIGSDGRLGARRRFLAIEPGQGFPDGIVSDAQGGIWVAFYGGWAARRYDADGNQTHEVRFPVANVTKIAIGGRDGTTAFATTARQGLDAAALAAQPFAGDLFSFAVDIPAAPIRGFRS